MTTNSAELKQALRDHDDHRLYLEADVLMSKAADRIEELERKLELEAIERQTFQHGLRLKEQRIAELERRTAAQGEPSKADEPKCGCCGGTGRMVRDPDIGTDQECFACDGTGRGEDDQAGSAEQVSEREAEQEALKDLIVDVLQNHGWNGRLLDCNYAEAADDIIEAIYHRAALSAPERKVTDAKIRELAHKHLKGTGDHCIINFARAILNQQGEQTAPVGFVIVPKESPKMGSGDDWLTDVRDEFNGVVCDWSVVDSIYKAIIAAAPSTAQKDGGK